MEKYDGMETNFQCIICGIIYKTINDANKCITSHKNKELELTIEINKLLKDKNNLIEMTKELFSKNQELKRQLEYKLNQVEIEENSGHNIINQLKNANQSHANLKIKLSEFLKIKPEILERGYFYGHDFDLNSEIIPLYMSINIFLDDLN